MLGLLSRRRGRKKVTVGIVIKATRGILVVMELFGILTVVVDRYMSQYR